MNDSGYLSIIIPYYNASKTIESTLMSICIQNIKNKCNIIIVDDGSTKQEHYKLIDIIKKFNTYIKIDYIHYDENKGPGYARQKGLDSCETKYVTFIDADDTFATSTALFILCNELDNHDECAVVSANFLEEVRNTDNEYVAMYEHKQDMTWMFGKVYRLSFIDKYNIEFNDSRANEDSGFNAQFLLYSNDDTIRYLDSLVYCWNYNSNSITKNNDYSFYGLKGYIDNHIWCIHKVYQQYINNKDEHNIDINIMNIIGHILNTTILIYLYRMELLKNGRNKNDIDVYDEWAIKFYKEIYIFFKDYYNNEDIKTAYFKVLETHSNLIKDFILPISIYDYLKLLNNKMLNKYELVQIVDVKNNLLGYVKETDKDKIDTENLDMQADYFITFNKLKDL